MDKFKKVSGQFGEVEFVCELTTNDIAKNIKKYSLTLKFKGEVKLEAHELDFRSAYAVGQLWLNVQEHEDTKNLFKD